MSALVGYKHWIIALEGQSTVIFSKRRKISSIWTDPCVELNLQPAVSGGNPCRTGHALLERDMFCRKNKKDIQHPRFPCSPLPKYWSGPTVLNFAVRMGCGAFTVVWPYDKGPVPKSYSSLKTKISYIKKINKYFSLFFFVIESVRDTRSAWKYCKTRATLGRGVAQALQDPNHGLNNSLKLMWRHAPRTRD